MNQKRKNQGIRMAGNKQAQHKQRRVPRRRRGRTVAPRTAKQFFAMSPRSQDRWNRIAHAISKMREEGLSVKKAAKEYGLAPQTVIRSAKPALRKARNGRYVARPTDKLLRVLTLPFPDGLREVAVRDSRQASRVAKYWNALRKYQQTGNASALEKLPWKTIIDANGKRTKLLTNLEALDRLASAGVMSFESLYARAA